MNRIIGQLSNESVLIIGDLMLDHYLMGTVERISPEAPVPVVEVCEEKTLLGGAGNVARNVAALGGTPELVSVVGDDADGACLADRCGDASIIPHLITDRSRPTTKKTRVIAHNQQVVRVDHEQSRPLDPDLYNQLFEILEQRIDHHRVIILSDYGKGIISKQFMVRFMELVDKCPERPMVLVDPKTRNFDLYIGVDLLTPNRKEASEGARQSAHAQQEIMDTGRAIISRLKSKHLLITLGADGMAYFESPDIVYHIPTTARKVFDVTGAGDTVIATIAMALAAGNDLLTACILANYAAGIVVGQVGAATATQEQLMTAFDAQPDPGVSRWS